MSAYLGKSKRIKNALVALLQDVTYDTGAGPEPAYTQVLDNNRGTFDGYPNVQVLPGRESITRPTTGQADKAPDYILRTRIQMEDTDIAQSAAFDQMYDLSDLIIDAINQADHDSTMDDGQGPMGVYMMNVDLGEWMQQATSAGVLLTFDINVAITYSQNL